MRLSTWGRGPLAVKLAGLAGGVFLFREEMSAAVDAGIRVAALDTSGDRRDDPAPSPLSWDGLADEVVHGLNLLGSRRAVLWGTSFGCVVALATAARYPERVSGLLLCHPPDPRWRPALYRELFDWLLRRPDPERATAVFFRLAFGLLNGWEFVAPTAVKRFPGLLREAVAAATPSATILQKLRLLWWEDPGLPPAGADLPVLIIAGAWDTVAPAFGARRLAARLPGARTRILGFSGHVGPYSRPAAYTRMVLEDLRELTRGHSSFPASGVPHN